MAGVIEYHDSTATLRMNLNLLRISIIEYFVRNDMVRPEQLVRVVSEILEEVNIIL